MLSKFKMTISTSHWACHVTSCDVILRTRSPFCPRGPSAPRSPFSPLGPIVPSGPGIPCSPSIPCGPTSPGIPWQTNSIIPLNHTEPGETCNMQLNSWRPATSLPIEWSSYSSTRVHVAPRHTQRLPCTFTSTFFQTTFQTVLTGAQWAEIIKWRKSAQRDTHKWSKNST